MTIEELAKLKKGDKLMWRGNVVTMKRFNIIVDRGGDTIYLGDDDIEQIELPSGPTLPSYISELYEWDGTPKAIGKTGVLWNEIAPQYVEFRSSGNPSTLPEWGLVPRNRKEAK